MYPSPNSPTGRGDESNSDVCTPPLVFTPHFVGGSTPPQYVEGNGTPPMQPLQVFTNFNPHSSGASLPRRESQLFEAENSPIRVKARTRDGRHSPYLAANPNAGQMDIEGQGVYGFSYSGTSSPLAVSTPTSRAPVPNFGQLAGDEAYNRGEDYSQGMNQAHMYNQHGNYYMGGGGGAPPQSYAPGMPTQSTNPYAMGNMPQQYQQQQQQQQGQQQRAVVAEKVYSHSSLDPAFELPSQVVHRALKGRCRFIAFPNSLPAQAAQSTTPSTAPQDDNGVALFIGQVRFETTPAELTWLVQRTCGAVASRLEGRGAGCYLLYCRGKTDLQLIRGLHKRVLFDVGGAWLARTPEEVDALCEYVAIDAPLLSKKARLPRDSMVVEDLKLDAAPPHRGGSGGDGGGTPGHGAKRSGPGHGGSNAHNRHNNSNHNNNNSSQANTQSSGNDGQANQRPQHGTGQHWRQGNGSNHSSAPPPPPEYASTVQSAGGNAGGPSPPPYGTQ